MRDRATTIRLLTGLIQKQMMILGPNVALSRAKKVTGLIVSDKGEVTDIAGDPEKALEALIDEYTSLSGDITKIIVQSLISSQG